MRLYALLGVPPDARPDEIDAGYRRVCAVTPGSGRFSRLFGLRRWHRRQVERAYRILRDPVSRQRYDAAVPMIEMLARSPPGLL